VPSAETVLKRPQAGAWGESRSIDCMSPIGVALLLLLSVALCWPMLVVSTPLVFFDSESYLSRGHQIVQFVWQMIAGSGESAGQGAAAVGGAAAAGPGVMDANAARGLRSAPYSLFAYVFQLPPAGLIGPAVVQTFLVLLMFWAAIGPIRLTWSRESLSLLLVCVLLTPLPWFASYLMPDLFAAAIMLYAMVLVGRFDQIGFFQRGLLCLIAAWAVLCHYGHPPLAVAAFAAALGIRLLQWRLGLSVIAFAVAPILLAFACNFVLSLVAFNTASVAPKRLPILLARSLEDGPARWHLTEHCATYHYQICTILDHVPDTVSGLLFEEQGLRHTTAAEMDKIRAEEPIILWRALKEYPLEQAMSFMENSADQFISFGLEDFSWADVKRAADGTIEITLHRKDDRALFVAFNVVQVSVLVLACALLFYVFASGRVRRGDRATEMLLVVLATLLANAAIFGGLSEPADRYQTRLVWVVTAVACVYWVRRESASEKLSPPII
jgi:hypothetical protein